MDLSSYNEFVKSMKVYPEQYAMVYPALGLAGEAGEIAEKVKKYLRGDHLKLAGPDATSDGVIAVTQQWKNQLLSELGDPLWYITSLADDLGFTLQEVIDRNVEKLSSRKERGVLKGSGDDR